MITFERRQRLIDLVRHEPGLRVPEMARRLGVSQGTVRNDLQALADEGHLKRVRGGATLPESQAQSPAFETRARLNEAAKRAIARRAAELVQDGDSILLDASTTVYYMAGRLSERRELTVITNGIQVAARLAQNPSNTVILIGGVLRSDGTSVTGLLGEQFLRELHAKTAFVSCTGFSPAVGLTEVDIHEAQIKSRMVTSAREVIALVDSTKFGKVDLTPFARAEQISLVLTDGALGLEWVQKLQARGIPLALCPDDPMPALAQPPERLDAQRRGDGFR